MSCHKNWSSMEVIHPKSIKIFSHLSDILKHICPRSLWIGRLTSVSYSYQISPNIHFSTEIIILLWDHKQFSRIITSYPTVIQCEKFTISTINSRKVFVDQRVRVIKTSISVLNKIMSHITYSITQNLWYPFIYDLCLPFFIETCNG